MTLFLRRLAMYWRSGLVDKEMIKEQMGSTVVFESFVIDMTYREAHLNAGAMNFLKKMSDEIARIPHRFQRLEDLLIKLKIAK